MEKRLYLKIRYSDGNSGRVHFGSEGGAYNEKLCTDIDSDSEGDDE